MREQMKSKEDGGHGGRHAAFGQYMFLIPASVGDFVSDILFCSVATFDPDYYLLGIVAFLHLGSCALLNGYYGEIIYRENERDDDHVNKNKLAYALLMLLSLSSLELWALFAWDIKSGDANVDGFPPRGDPIKKAKQAAVCEDVPQLIFQLIYLIAKRSRSSTTWFSLSFTTLSICMRLAYRALETQQARQENDVADGLDFVFGKSENERQQQADVAQAAAEQKQRDDAEHERQRQVASAGDVELTVAE